MLVTSTKKFFLLAIIVFENNLGSDIFVYFFCSKHKYRFQSLFQDSFNSLIILKLVFLIVLQPIKLIIWIFKHELQRTRSSFKNTHREIKLIKNYTWKDFLNMEGLFKLIKDIWGFLKLRKKYWVAPLIIIILMMDGLIVFTQGWF